MGFVDRFVAGGDRTHRPEEVRRRERRVQTLGTGELPLWTDNAISEVGKHIQQYLRTGDDAFLKEAKIGAETLLTLIEELERRVP